MSRYIDADKIEYFPLALYIHQVTTSEMIGRIPTADVEPVVHGHNSGKDYAECDQFVCSKCGIELQGWSRIERDPDDGEEYHCEYIFKRCPECGAKMDEDMEEDNYAD